MSSVTAAARRAAVVIALCAVTLPFSAARAGCHRWPAWEQFAAAYISDDGRVIDHDSAERLTVSEGQAYALLFAVVAGDRARFDRLLAWTTNNLAAGDLDEHLPAWSWGHKSDGTWGVLDSNSAADADLWLAYALFEASRLWHEPTYRARAKSLAARILREETAVIPGLGRVLLPAAQGFVSADGWRLNPSYTPLQVLRLLSRKTREPAWNDIATQSMLIIRATAPLGFAPDWTRYQPATGFSADPSGGVNGSWAAIRVYLWAGMLAPEEPARRTLLEKLRPMAELVAHRATPPLTINTHTGATSGDGPAGFHAALVPFLQAEGDSRTAARERRRAAAAAAPIDAGRGYYDAVLTLFGSGFAEHRYRFAPDGALQVPWAGTCAA
ncbi:MAG: cellulose synthase complex periplasmic endoglucanase BcsZ [Steroidobacterales bacterium]